MKYCSHCGAQINDNSNFCENCGQPVSNSNTSLDKNVTNDVIKNIGKPKKKIFIAASILIAVCIIGLIGFKYSGYFIKEPGAKFVDEGIEALKDGKYGEAKDLFQQALDKSSKDQRAETLMELTENYMELCDKVDNYNFEDTDGLVTAIEENKYLKYIKNDYDSTSNSLKVRKQEYGAYDKDVAAIEDMLNNNDIDNAKEEASDMMDKVESIEPLKNRLNTVIDSVNEKIADAQAVVEKLSGEEVHYFWDVKEGESDYPSDLLSIKDDSIDNIKGKLVLEFQEDGEGSPAEYYYFPETGDVFKNTYSSDGKYTWLNKNYYWIDVDGYGKFISKEEYEKKEAEKNKGNSTTGKGYSDEQLCQMAKKYYLSHNGQEPPIVEVDHVDGDMVTIHLYEIVVDHTATWEWYTVNRKTAVGTTFMGDKIDLR